MPPRSSAATELTVFTMRACDQSGRGTAGALSLGDELAARLGVPAIQVAEADGTPVAPERDRESSGPSLAALARRYEEIMEMGATPVTAFSRCPTGLATLPVIAKHRPGTAQLWFDAHPDLNTPEGSATGYFGGLALSGPMGLWDSGLGEGVETSDVILIGIRDIDPPEGEVIDRLGITVVEPGPDLPGRLDAVLAGRPVYIHFDCDVLEPGIVPLDYEVPGGLDLETVRGAAEVIGHHELVGVEIGEFEASSEEEGEPARLVDALEPAFAGLAS